MKKMAYIGLLATAGTIGLISYSLMNKSTSKNANKLVNTISGLNDKTLSYMLSTILDQVGDKMGRKVDVNWADLHEIGNQFLEQANEIHDIETQLKCIF